MLRAWLLEFPTQKVVYHNVMLLLERLPVQYKNQIQRSKIDQSMKTFENNEDPEVAKLSKEVGF